jgi:hypothetical protein
MAENNSFWRRPGFWILVVVIVAIVGSISDEDGTDDDGRVDSVQEEEEFAGNETSISSDEFGNEWPLTVDEGIVRCEGAGEVYFTADGTTYSVNGLAMGNSDLPDIDVIWADDPEISGLKINISPIIDRGLELCD